MNITLQNIENMRRNGFHFEFGELFDQTFNNYKKIALMQGLVMLVVLLAFVMLNTYYKWQTANQQKLIVYNVPQHRAIDIVNGNRYQFIGDSILLQDGLLQNFHLKPGRINQQLITRSDSLSGVFKYGMFYQINNKKVLIIDRPISFDSAHQKIEIDLLVVSKNPKLNIARLTKAFTCKLIVFDASNSLWKIETWKKDCEQLHLQLHSVPEKGAFILDL